MGTELVNIERALGHLVPQFTQVLGRTMPPERFMRTIVISIERNPELENCDRQSLFNAAMTFATLGLEVDSATGQGFLIPFKDRKNNRSVVQAVIGYLGYNTLGARAGMTITGRVVREGDDFDFDESTGFVHHKRLLGGETGPNKRRIIAAWARATANNRPPIARVLSIDELLAVQAKSPRGNQPPWSDPEIGFPAMAEKTAKRRLRRDMPLTVYQLAGAMEEQHEELGHHSWIHPDKGVMIGNGEVIAPNHSDVTPTAEQLLNPPDHVAEARMAAERGTEAFRAFCRRFTKPVWAQLKQRLDLEALQRIATEADNGQGD